MSVVIDGIDWADQTRTDRITAYMVCPTALAQTWGSIDGVVLDGSKVSYAYYSDTRVSGTLVVHGTGWRRGSFVRIVHSIPGTSYSRELGTFIVTDDGGSRGHGSWDYSLTLHSALYGLSTDVDPMPHTIKQGRSLHEDARWMLGGRPYRDAVTVDASYDADYAQEGGNNWLRRFAEVCDDAGIRYSVDGHGRILMANYVAPAKRTERFSLDPRDPRGICHDDLSVSTDWLRMAGRVTLHYKGQRKVEDGVYKRNGTIHKKGETKYKNEDVEFAAAAEVTSGHASRGVRGYIVTDYHSVDDMSPQTQDRANEMAREFLAQDSVEDVEWQLTTQYVPVREGDVGRLYVPDGYGEYTGWRKVMVKSCDVDLGRMQCRLTLKSASSNDVEEMQ